MSFPRYPAYKDSGVEWLGNVPVHWGVMSLVRDIEFITSGARGWAENYSDDGDLFIRIGNLTRDSINLDLSDVQRVVVPASAEVDRTQVQSGDVLFSITAYLGSVAVVPPDLGKAFVSQHVALVRPKQHHCIPAWIGYVAISHVGKSHLETTGYGGTKVQLSLADVTTMPVSVPMKDSGVEWLGEVPAHWGISRLKNMSPEVTVGVVVEPSKYYCEDGIPALRSLNVMPMDIRQEGYVYFSAESNELLAKSKLQVGDLVAVRSGQPGTTAVVPNELDGCNCIDLIIIRKPATDDARFMAWYLNSDAAIRQFTEGSGGAIQQHFNVGTAMNLLLTRPPAEEQLRIVAEIDRRTQEIDRLLSEAVLSIELLRERRTAVISAAVTGQIDVRGLAPAQEQAA